MAKKPEPAAVRDAPGTGMERAAAAVCDWIAGTPPFQRRRRGEMTCLYCGAAERAARRDRASHGDDCLWRRVGELGARRDAGAAVGLAREFAASGPWERPTKEGGRECFLCGTQTPSHTEACPYFQVQLRRAIGE